MRAVSSWRNLLWVNIYISFSLTCYLNIWKMFAFYFNDRGTVFSPWLFQRFVCEPAIVFILMDTKTKSAYFCRYENITVALVKLSCLWWWIELNIHPHTQLVSTQNWRSRNQITGLSQCQYPGCEIVPVWQIITMSRNLVRTHGILASAVVSKWKVQFSKHTIISF